MMVYHFYLFLSMADRGYLYLSLFIICYGVGQTMAVFGFLADWGFTDLQLMLRWMHWINFLAAFFAFSLSRHILKIEKFVPWCDKTLKVILGIILVLVPLSIAMPFMLAEKILIYTKLIPLPFLLGAGIVACCKGYRPGVLFLFAASIFIGGVVLFNLMYGFDLFAFHEYTYFLPYIALIITLSLFSFGLADRINLIRKEREEAREQALADLDAKLHIQEEKTAIERELEHSRKMETIGRLLSGVAHDMKNFLVPVLGYAQLLRKGCKGDSMQHRQAERLINATNRLKDLSTTLVDVSRKKPVGMHPVALNAAIEQIGSLLKHSAPIGVSIKTVASSEMPVIPADEGMLHSALLNVGINAIDALVGGGIITITTGIETLSAGHPALRRTGNAPGRYAQISVEDTGSGMTAEVQAHLFEPFFTTKTDGKGTGLGLASVYNCIVTHTGCIDLRSAPGEGSRITLYFPTTAPTHQEPQIPVVLPVNRALRILTVDDERELIAVTSDILIDLGHESLTAVSGVVAIDTIKRLGDSIDLVLLDYRMPGMNGLECLQRIHEIRPLLPVIVTSAHLDENDIAHLQNTAFTDFLPKPFDVETLEEAINRALLATGPSPR